MSQSTAPELQLTVDAPKSLAGAAQRVEQVDREQLVRALGQAGLELPPRVHVTLIAEADGRARGTPPWIVGRAFAPYDVVIFPERLASSYPYDSLESTVRHEIVHLALAARAGAYPLPRWFHEGVAVSVESGWGITDRARLLFALAGEPAIGDVERLFGSNARQQTTRAYLLAAVLVADVRRRHGLDVPGAIAGHVAAGTPFRRAFELETGESADAAAARAWQPYRRWTVWIPVVARRGSVWLMVLAIAALAFIARRRRRARQRRRWEEEEGEDEEHDEARRVRRTRPTIGGR
ncbi:MAG: hypothetical protein GEV06_19105 [Luteitalea sp.]|nr:hypothetical protein [Luteitalea sp.]